MSSDSAWVFVDGGYFRQRAEELGKPWPIPFFTAKKVLDAAAGKIYEEAPLLRRVNYYDCDSDESEVATYWRALKSKALTHLRFGYLRARAQGKPRSQKAVDVQLAVDLLEGAHARNFTTVVLIAGDADFVPVVEAVQRQGIHVLIVGTERTLSAQLRECADSITLLEEHAIASFSPDELNAAAG